MGSWWLLEFTNGEHSEYRLNYSASVAVRRAWPRDSPVSTLSPVARTLFRGWGDATRLGWAVIADDRHSAGPWRSVEQLLAHHDDRARLAGGDRVAWAADGDGPRISRPSRYESRSEPPPHVCLAFPREVGPRELRGEVTGVAEND